MRRVIGGLATLLLLAPGAPASAEEGVWVPSLPPDRINFGTVSLLEDGTGYVLRAEADVPGTTLFRTRDGGQTWDRISAISALTPGARLRMATADEGYAVDGSLLHTTDGGLTFAPVADPPRPPDPEARVGYGDVAVANGGAMVAVGGSARRAPPECTTNLDDDTTLLARSGDGGASWEVAELPFPGAVRRVAVSATGEVAALTAVRDEFTRPSIIPGGCATTFFTPFSDAVYLFFPVDDADGEPAAEKVLDCTEVECTAVAFPAPGVLVVGLADGTILRSDDGGATFTATALQPALPETPGRSLWVGAISFVDTEVGYAATNGAGVYRTGDGGSTWTEETSAHQAIGVGFVDLATTADGAALLSGPQGVTRRTTLD